MTAERTPDPTPGKHPGPDPRELLRIEARYLIVNQRAQREVNSDRVARIVAEFDWDLFEPITVTLDDRGYFVVVEGQHRTLAVQGIDHTLMVPAIVLRPLDEPAQAETALGIIRSRKGHTAYDTWTLNLQAGHPHEVMAGQTLAARGLRLGKSPSPSTIGAVATVRTIVHGGHLSPELGAERLGDVLDVLMGAFPSYDHDSSTSRWERDLLLAVNSVLIANPDGIDLEKLAKAVRIKPAEQWLSIGRQNASPSHEVIAQHIKTAYNRGLKSRKIK